MDVRRVWEIICFASTPAQGAAALLYIGKELWPWLKARKQGAMSPFTIRHPFLLVALICGSFITAGIGFWLVFHPPKPTAAESTQVMNAAPPSTPHETVKPSVESAPTRQTLRNAAPPRRSAVATQRGHDNQQTVDKGSLTQNNSGGINVQQGTTGNDSPIINSPITVGEVPLKIDPSDAKNLVAFFSQSPTKPLVSIGSDQYTNPSDFPSDFYHVLHDAGWVMKDAGVQQSMGFAAPGAIFRGVVVTIHGEPFKQGDIPPVSPYDPLWYLDKAFVQLKIAHMLKREPSVPEGSIYLTFEGGLKKESGQ
jgi:hypothetical protein